MEFMDVKNSHLRKLLEPNEDSIPLWNDLQVTNNKRKTIIHKLKTDNESKNEAKICKVSIENSVETPTKGDETDADLGGFQFLRHCTDFKGRSPST